MARPPSPLQQGDLDGLCGAYAMVNAVTRLMHDRGFTRGDAGHLFRRLCRALHRRRKMPEAVWRGTHIEDVDAMLRTVQRFLREEFGTRLCIERPFQPGTAQRKDTFFRVLSRAFRASEGRTLAIIGLDRPGFHWTIATEVTPRSFRLYDSGHSKRIRYSDCTLGGTVRHRQLILAAETRLLSLPPAVAKPIRMARSAASAGLRVAA